MDNRSAEILTPDWASVAAVLFDLDGVLTPTAEVHMRAWHEMFDAYLTERHPGLPAYTEQDYFDHIDGKPRYDGVRDFLADRGITLPEGDRDDPGSAETVCGLGNRKNDMVNEILARDGVRAYPGSLRLLDHLRGLGVPLAVVSSSANAPTVLRAAGISDRFATVVDGRVAAEHHLPGKPAPDTFLYAAELLRAPADRAVVLEDATSGVRAGAAGGFAAVVGVDRGAGHESLARAGATLVVSDLAELVPTSPSDSGDAA